MEKDITLKDVYEILIHIQDNAVHKDDFSEFKENTEKRLGSIEKQVNQIEKRVDHIENQMVTKEYLDKKLSETDTRVPLKRLVTILVKKDVITVQDQETIALKV